MQPDQNQNIGQPQSGGLSQDYNFIMADSKPPSKLNGLLRGSLTTRILVLLGGLLILLIVFAIVKSLLTTPQFSTADYITVTQQQAEINYILTTDLTADTRQAALTPANNNFAISAQLSIASAQSQILTYLKTNHVKVSPKQLTANLDKSVDTQLSNSLTTNDFNQVFVQVMQNELQIYAKDLSRAYNTSRGPKGRTMLINQYNGARLLYKQLSAPAS
jgi:hypothetical protein